MKWTPEEDAILFRYYDRLPYVEIAAKIGRNTRTVAERAKHLGLNAQRNKERKYPKSKPNNIPPAVIDELIRTPKIELDVLLRHKQFNGCKGDELGFYLRCLIVHLGSDSDKLSKGNSSFPQMA